MTSPAGSATPRAWSWLVALAIALVVAVVLCTVQAVAIVRFRDPRPTHLVRLGEDVVVNGTRFRLDKFTVADRLPAKEPNAPPVPALNGAALIQSIMTVEVIDEHRDRTTIWCEFSLVDRESRRWNPEWEFESEVAGPEAVTCTGPYDDKIKLRRPIQVGRVFQVPESVASQVRLRVRLGFEEEMIEFRR